MLNLIRSCVQQEIANVLTSVIFAILLFFGMKYAVTSIEEFVNKSEDRYRDTCRMISSINHEIHHINEDIDELYDLDSDASSDTSSGYESEKPESDHVTV